MDTWNIVLTTLPKTFWQKPTNFCSMSINDWKKKTLNSLELFSSILTFGNLESSFDSLREKTARSPNFLAQCTRMKTDRSFYKNFFLLEMFLLASRLQFWQSCQKHVDRKPIFFRSMSGNEKKNKSTFFKIKTISQRDSFGQVECNIENAAGEKVAKKWFSLDQIWKRIEKHILY